MVKFIIPSHLIQLLDSKALASGSSMPVVLLDPGPWTKLIGQIRKRFPKLAGQVLTESDNLAMGFILALNDEVIRSDYSALHFRSGDEFSIIAAMAGG